MDICDRIKIVRKDLNLTQEEFGNKLGMSRSMIVNLEMDRLKNIDQVKRSCKMISSIFNINEEWLLTGEGEMKAPLTREAEIADLAAKLYGSDPDSFQYKVFMFLKDLPVEDWLRFESLLREMTEKLL